ncbi:hypothetical protein PDESU_00253 [Pontiella desulfatans]|uniref:Glycosyl hydrolase family 98 putative carbohydrate-binding module domain-containing protein n=1 Tax=Pontiella desulfatans TaxID=2750659 RepID=A0A6C2TVX2_PONDE|nr:NPCBM/NEW2 domain-containing protein [Pontiella desulfatans]VGO11707.1 hypothetical protein PDESU_00253 [Pontiella desulfatans]
MRILSQRLMLAAVFLLGLPALAGPRECLHLVYVTNRDRPPLADYENRVHRMMVDVQDFYRTEMARNGHGPKTFRLDLGVDGKANVHLVTLDWDFDPHRKFTPGELRPAIAETLSRKGIDIEQEYLVVFENAYWKDGDTWTYDVVYTGSGNPVKGATWVADHEWLDPRNLDPKRKERINDRGHRMAIGQFNVKMIGGVAHELGHGLGLPHNRETEAESKRLGKALMGAGNYTYRQERLGSKPHGSFLTPAHAFILSLHPLFSGRVPGGFAIPPVFPEELAFTTEGGRLMVSGRVAPVGEVAGVVLYHDALPTGTNKDYDAFSYLAEMKPDGAFRATLPLLDGQECALHVKVYFKNGMHRKFSFTQGQDGGLERLRTGYLKEQARHAFEVKDAARLRTVIKELETADPASVKAARLFLGLTEQWEGFCAPVEVAAAEQAIGLSSCRWSAASVGWHVPSFNGVLDPDGKWFQPLASAKGKCPQGLYAHAPSSYAYALGGKWKSFESRMALHRGHQGSVVFVVKGDGRELFRSSLLRLADGEADVRVNVSGIQTLELVTEPGPDGKDGDWGIWIAPSLLRH